jgi:tRNA-dependent cyclodipeptide synthase
MQLYSIRGGSKQELENKQYNIGVSVSLGNKWFTPENIVEAVKWSLQHTREKVVIYVADSIHAINLQVRNRISYEKAIKITTRLGENLFLKVKEELSDLPPDQLQRIEYVKWNEIIDEKFREKLSYLSSEYKNNKEFIDFIHSIVKDHISKEERVFLEDDIHKFGQYIVEEMPEFINRVKMKEIIVDAYTYPQDNMITTLAEQIQNGQIFPEIKKNIMDTKPKVFLELR